MNYPTAIDNILFPTDFSALSENALNTAIAICKRHQATLHMLHVVEMRYIIAPQEALTTAVYVLPGMEETAAKNMAALADKMKQEAAIDVETYLLTGNPADGITSKAIELGCDLIVMGTHGASGIRAFFIGTNAYSVIKNTSIPVLTIPGDREVSAFKKILFPIRATGGIMEKYDFIEPIIEKNQSELVVTALSLPDETVSREALDAGMGKLATTLRSNGVLFRAAFYVCDNYAKKVLELAEKTKADLVVINATLDYTWSQFFIGPYTQQVVNHAKIPVLSIRTAWPPAGSPGSAAMTKAGVQPAGLPYAAR